MFKKRLKKSRRSNKENRMPRGIPNKAKNYYCIGENGKIKGPYRALTDLKKDLQNIDPEATPTVLREVGKLEVRQRVALQR
jgi:hypothetical protein